MATQGITFELTDKEKEMAVKYCEESGLYMNRLADFLGISRPTVYKLLEEDTDFFTRIKRADAVFCKNLIMSAEKKDPIYLLRKKFREEF